VNGPSPPLLLPLPIGPVPMSPGNALRCAQVENLVEDWIFCSKIGRP